MAGEHEPPVRYRGQPPRYSERVVDTANPASTRSRGRVTDDEWGAEAYAPGLPRAEYGGAPADWDDVPLRPERRRGRRDEAARPRREAEGAEHGTPRQSRSDHRADGARRGRPSGASGAGTDERSAERRGESETPRGNTEGRRRGTAEARSAAPGDSRRRRDASGERGRTSSDHDTERHEAAAARARQRAATNSPRSAGATRTRRDQEIAARPTGGAVPEAGGSAATGSRSRPVESEKPSAGARPVRDGAGGRPVRDGSARPPIPALDPDAGPAAADTGVDTDAARTPAESSDGAAAATSSPAPGAGSETGYAGIDGAEHDVRSAGFESADGQGVPGETDSDGRRSQRAAEPAQRTDHDDEHETSAGELPAGFDRVDLQTDAARSVMGDERPTRRGTERDGGSDAARSAEASTPRRSGRGQRTLRDRNGRRMSSYDQLGRTPRRDENDERRTRRSKPAKQRNQGPALLDDASRARLEAAAREGTGLRAAWATFRIHTDDLRRVNAAARTDAVVEDGFDRGTAQLTDRGYVGEGGGRMNVIGRPVEYRATTAQVAGLWPWSVGAGAPLIGTPLGSHLHTGAPVCFDPMNWFMRGSFITAPSLFVLGLNGFGKSSLVRRIVLGGVAQGITPLILADVKPDYRRMVEVVGGQVIDLGYGHGKLNPLAGGVLGSIVPLLGDLPDLRLQVTQELRARQVTLIAGLVELVRGARVRDYEETLISTALRILYREGSGFAPESPPIMEDLLEVVIAGGQELMLDAGADNAEEYHEATKGLRRSLRALTQGPFGAVFNGQTTTPIDTSSVAVCIDVSHIPTGDKKLKAAVMLACWADGFASVEAAHVLADGKLGPQRYFQVVMDELWQVLGLGDFMVDRVDELTRLQRGMATSLIMISHTIKDLQSLGSEAAIAKALGFLERARAKIFGALPPEEISRLDSTIPFTSAEEEMVTSWSAPQALTGEALKPGQARPPAPGTGKFLLKIGEDRRPGIPFHMEFTPSERESGIHETNQRFSEFTESTARRGDEGSAA